jgi:hypothetical protein
VVGSIVREVRTWPKAESTADGPRRPVSGEDLSPGWHDPKLFESQQSRTRMISKRVSVAHIAAQGVDRLVPAHVHHLEQGCEPPSIT